ncbi:MAG: N-acetyltransferase [Chloroflexota bacterium]
MTVRLKVEKARIADVPQIHKLINSFAEKGEMLPRALSEIYENLRDFYIIREDGEVIACVALHISWSDLAEIKSLAVNTERQELGLGSMLIQACLDEAGQLGIPRLFCLTYKPSFFEKANFKQVDKMELPRKVWSECYRCPKFPNCDEAAMVYDRP